MNSKEFFQQLFSYDHWANRECISSLRKAGAAGPDVIRLMAHTLSAQKLWLERLRREPPSMPVWPSSTIQDCADLADQMADSWRNYLNELSPDAFNEKTEYRNTKGELFTSRVEDVLTHVLLHSAYHRGQLALQMRAAGFEPAYTDFIHAVRKGFIGRESR